MSSSRSSSIFLICPYIAFLLDERARGEATHTQKKTRSSKKVLAVHPSFHLHLRVCIFWLIDDFFIFLQVGYY
jgi:hypothetical protein